MTGAIIELVIALVGLAATAVLFFRIPRLTGQAALPEALPEISVIIPARNEERNLALILNDLVKQSLPPLEIIVVDDLSEDGTAAVALAHGVRLISVRNKPEGWTGKTWACQCGAEAAGGELLLFLDTDVRLGKHGLRRLLSEFIKQGGAVSVQPWHRTERHYEQFSMIFNLVQIAANGSALPWRSPEGLYGPVILISRDDYRTLGGHQAVKASIVEDMSLGLRLKQLGLPYSVCIGDGDIAFRMYAGGFRSLLEGWTKNLASGAAKTPHVVFLLVFLWISSLASAPYHLVLALAGAHWAWAALYGVIYAAWALVLNGLTTQIGRFRRWPILLYPLPLLVFFSVFVLSAIKKIFRLKVRWKGRAIPMEAKKCD
jgi:4,4'-diaponeurosporenoate glycosyltransferase